MQANNTQSGSITKLWYIPLFSFLMPLGSPFGLLYISSVGKKDTWLAAFFITLFIQIISLVFLFTESDFLPAVGGALFGLNWVFVLLFMISTAKEFLRISSTVNQAPVQTQSSQVKDSATSPIVKSEAVKMGEKLIENLHHWQREIESTQMQNDLGEIIKICTLVMQRDDEHSRRFFSRYADRLDSMLARYDEIENTRLDTPEMLKTMALIEKSVGEIVIAFRNELNEMYKRDLLDLNADTAVFIQELKNKGLIED